MAKGHFEALIVDDSAINITLLETLLRSFGLSCQSATQIQDASNLVLEQEFDISFIDLHMPVQSGVDFIKAAAANGTLARLGSVLIVTADIQFTPQALGLEHLISGYLLKPIDIKELESHLRRELDQGRSLR